MIKECKTEAIGLICICDKCNKGEMLPTGENMWNSTHPFKHRCTECGNEEFYSDKYPTIKHKIIY